MAEGILWGQSGGPYTPEAHPRQSAGTLVRNFPLMRAGPFLGTAKQAGVKRQRTATSNTWHDRMMSVIAMCQLDPRTIVGRRASNNSAVKRMDIPRWVGLLVFRSRRNRLPIRIQLRCKPNRRDVKSRVARNRRGRLRCQSGTTTHLTQATQQ